MSSPPHEAVPPAPAFDDLLGRVLETLREFDRIQLRLDPAHIPAYQSALRPFAAALESATRSLVAEQSTEELTGPDGILLRAAGYLLKALTRFEAAAGPAAIQNAFLALRSVCRAAEELYPLAGAVDAVDWHFRDSAAAELPLARPASDPVPGETDAAARGVISVRNERGQRGGYSLYVPEYYSADRPWPLAIVCHGGSGHGADFLWSWLREARSHGLIVLSPSSRARTWSMQPPFADVESLQKMLFDVKNRYSIDPRRVLLTGISDGGTFALMNALLGAGGFTHYAPIASAIHAFTRQPEVLERLRGVPVYQVHGGRDWMFPVALAREAREALERAGARLVYREIGDLSHNYPRDENVRIIRWLRGETGA